MCTVFCRKWGLCLLALQHGHTEQRLGALRVSPSPAGTRPRFARGETNEAGLASQTAAPDFAEAVRAALLT